MFRKKKTYFPRDISHLYEYIEQDNFLSFENHYRTLKNDIENLSFLWKIVSEDICHMVSFYQQKKDEHSISILFNYHEKIQLISPEKLLCFYYYFELAHSLNDSLRKNFTLTRSTIYHFYDNLKHTKTLKVKTEIDIEDFLYYQSKTKEVNHLDSLLIKNEHNLKKIPISKI